MIKILGRKILVQEIVEEEKEEVTKAGIIIPGTSKAPRIVLKGTVVTFGVDCEVVKEGDIVYFDSQTAGEVFLEDIGYVVVDESSIFAVDSQ